MKSDPLIGQKLGEYRVIKKIGQGGMADIYQGQHLKKKQHAAIKIVGQHLRSDPTFTTRFLREARAVRSLDHPNIISVYDFGEYGGGHYMAMQYIDGTTLRGRMNYRFARNQRFKPDEIVALVEQVASALDYAHQQSMVHRDVKPANILLSKRGKAILADFGLVMLLNRVSQQTRGESFGTAEYIAPEQAIDSRAASPRSDVYSLGIILYEMTTRRLPFEAESAMSLALQHINQEPERPRALCPDLPLAVEAVILRAMAKEPQRRYASAGALTDALRAAYGDQLKKRSKARQKPSRAPTLKTRSRPKRRLFALGAFVLLLLLALAWLALNRQTQTTPQAGNKHIRDLDNMTMRFIPAGPFLMGSPQTDTLASPREQPQHEITLSAFWLDQTQVTNAQYRLCVQTDSCQPPVVRTLFDDENFGDHPVVYVTWEQASDYCAWLAQQTGWSVALPGEAQWEKAAAWNPRTKQQHRYPWGDQAPTPKLANTQESGLGSTAPIGSYPQGDSFYNVQDMAGNVWEWVADWYHADYYSNSPSTDPTGPAAGNQRVLRGGSYGFTLNYARTSYRDLAAPQASSDALGFRCATNAQELP